MKQTLKEQIQDILYESNVTRPARVALATPHNVEVCEIECERAENGLVELFKEMTNHIKDCAKEQSCSMCKEFIGRAK